MKKAVIMLMAFTLLFAVVSCTNTNGDVTTTENINYLTPEMTGYPGGTVQMPMLYLNGNLYLFDCYCYGGSGGYYEDSESFVKERNLTLIGETKYEQNEEPPTEEYCASRLPVGTKIYSDKENRIYVLPGKRMIALKLSDDSEN